MSLNFSKAVFINTAFEKLSDIFKVNLNTPIVDKALSYEGGFYRRDELEKKFEKQISFYESL
jgi:hypothetical protein